MYQDRTTKPEPGVGLRTDDHWSVDGIVFHSAFNMRGGLIARDLSIYGNHGQILGPTWGAGRDGPALEFDGDDYVDCGDISLAAGWPALSAGAWISVGSDHNGIIVSESNGNDGWMLYARLSAGNEFRWEVTTTSGRIRVDWEYGAGYPTGWHHLMGTYDGAKMRLYWDGSEKASENQTGTVVTPTGPTENLLIGKYPYGIAFEGGVSSVSIYSLGLIAAGVAALAQNSNIVYEPKWVPDYVTAGATYYETPSDTITVSEAVVKKVDKAVADTLSISEFLVKSLTIPVSDAIVISESTIKEISKVVADAVSISDSPVVTVTLVVSDQITISEATALTIQKVIADSITVSESTALTLQIDVTDAITITESLIKQLNIALEDAVSISEAIVKTINMILTDGVVIADSAATVIVGVVTQSESDTVIISDSVVTVKITGAPSHKARKDPIDRPVEEVEWQDIIEIDRRFDE